jgi:hypothetical protein
MMLRMFFMPRLMALLSGAPNARINPAGRIVASIQVLRMKIKLHRLGFNELLGSPFDVTIPRALWLCPADHIHLNSLCMRSGPTLELTGRQSTEQAFKPRG